MATKRKKSDPRNRDLLERLVQERTKELAQANEQLLLANQVKEEFLAHMSKEFRTPLNHIIDLAGLILEGGLGRVNARQKPGLDSILECSSRLRAIVDRILELCRIDIGVSSFLPGMFPVADILRNSLERVRPLAESSGAAILFRCENALGDITADEHKVSFIIDELLINALQFSGRDSRVKLSARSVKSAISSTVERDYLEITVADEGLGIGRDELERIFFGFEAAGPAPLENGKMGLGLALVRRFVELHGGRIWVDSSPGTGSTFTFIIPKEGPLPHAAATQRVLVASDDDGFLQMISHCLKEEGYEVVTAVSGLEALQRGVALPPDLFLVDLVLTELNGFEVCRRIKSHSGLLNVPVLIVVPELTRADQLRSAQAGADAFLVKPPDLQEILSKVRLLTAQKFNYETLKQRCAIAVSQARTDPLTGLANLREFWEVLDREIERSRRYNRFTSLAMIDIDIFKQFNDRHGHLAGDEVLMQAARIFRDQIRTSDIAVRYGGEEFIVIMPETGKEVALLVGEKLRAAFAEHRFLFDQRQPPEQLTISIGIATFPLDAGASRELVEMADKALYRAKEGGRNRVSS